MTSARIGLAEPSPRRRRGIFRWVFRAADGRLRAGWRVTFLLVAFLLLYAVAAGVTVLALVWYFGLSVREPTALQAALFRRLPYWPLLTNVATVPGVCVLVWCFRRYLDGRSWRSLGFEAGPRPGREAALGLALGVLVILLTLLPLAAGGYVVRVTWGGAGRSAGEWLAQVGIVLGILCVAAFMEELVARAYILTNLRKAVGPVAAVLISSAIFAGLHLGNAHASIVGVVNIFLAGVLLGIVFALTGRLWSAWALHLAWNVTLGLGLGLPVSGIALPALVRVQLSGSTLLTGGAFGLEASLWNTAALAGTVTVLVWFGPRFLGSSAAATPPASAGPGG